MNRAISAVKVEISSPSIVPYHKGGYVCYFSSQVGANSWSEVPYMALIQAQRIGRQWIISGSIDFEFSAWSNESTISGVDSIGIWIENKPGCNDSSNIG